MRRLPIGAEVQPGVGVHVRVWAPRRACVTFVHDRGEHELRREADGYFAALVPDVGAGTRYRFRLDGEGPFPDPASRFQPEGPHGPSEVIDPTTYVWTDRDWPGAPVDPVVYELHVGTFTPEGTFGAAERELPALAALGVNLIELMPIADFPGRFGWGYDGVDLYAPTWLYGRPDDLRGFVDAAHRAGVGVILDVVYNHLGPDGNYLREYGPYFSTRFEGEWGDPFDLDVAAVRELVIENAGYWIDELHLDGLRIDATQGIHDDSPEHVIAALVRRARAAAGGKRLWIVAENEPQDTRIVRSPDTGGYDVDALWNDDFHHTAVVALTGGTEAYLTDYRGTPQELISAVRRGYLYQGQRYSWQDQRRGTPALDLGADRFVAFLDNHDQCANLCGAGLRLRQMSDPAKHRAMTALLLLAPWTPMLFQGQERGATTRWAYFADHHPELAAMVRKGRFEWMRQFPSVAAYADTHGLPDPTALATFEACKLDPQQRDEAALALHRDLLRLRRDDPALQRSRRGHKPEGAVLSLEAFVLRFEGERALDDRLLIVNLGRDVHLVPAPEPLLAPPTRAPWRTAWSSQDCRYGGGGIVPLEREHGWLIPAATAAWMETS